LFDFYTLQKSFNFMQSGADMNKADFYSLTPLHRATEFGHIDVVEYLLQAGLHCAFVTFKHCIFLR